MTTKITHRRQLTPAPCLLYRNAKVMSGSRLLFIRIRKLNKSVLYMYMCMCVGDPVLYPMVMFGCRNRISKCKLMMGLIQSHIIYIELVNVICSLESLKWPIAICMNREVVIIIIVCAMLCVLPPCSP